MGTYKQARGEMQWLQPGQTRKREGVVRGSPFVVSNKHEVKGTESSVSYYVD